jgi:ABC-type Fe3+-hydroxamate transport system substrate-binding protein
MIQKHSHYIIQFMVVFLLLSACNNTRDQQEQPMKVTDAPAVAVQAPAPGPPDKNSLTGDWMRSDAGYRIQLSGLGDGGILSAAYFNPQPIHVGKAKWTLENGLLKVYIELSDENYPGSNYDLIYMPEKDLLVGKYYQAVEGVTYDVLFQRKK